MNNYSTNNENFPLNKTSINEFFRGLLEKVINDLLNNELSSFLKYEKYEYKGRNSGDSRNGFYERKISTEYGTLNLKIPRDRNGEFTQRTLEPYNRSSDTLEDVIIKLYQKGITTREISDLIEKMYGHYYSPSTISNITINLTKNIKAFHERKISDKYVAIYCDATFINVRRDTVAKEALHIIMGINTNGEKEILDYGIYPSEQIEHYIDLLRGLKSRGLEQVLLFITDGLKGLRNALLEEFPNTKHQACWTHLARNVMKHIRKKDMAKVMQDFTAIHEANNKEEAIKLLYEFISKYEKMYPRAMIVLEDFSSFFTYYDFPNSIKRTIYTTNLIENLNKNLKRGIKRKEQFPNEEALDRYAGTFFENYNCKYSDRYHIGFKEAKSELLNMFQ